MTEIFDIPSVTNLKFYFYISLDKLIENVLEYDN